MLKTSLVLAFLLLLAPPAPASVVIHDGAPGIVAISDNGSSCVLDSNGHVWNFSDGWHRLPDWDVPMPIENIKFWEAGYLITMNNELWVGFPFVNWGPWPGGAMNVQEQTWGQIKARYVNGEQPVREGE